MNNNDVADRHNAKFVFWSCFISLIAASMGFGFRAQIIGDWGLEFGLSPTQQGEIFGVGLWPFAISIVLLSLVVDKIGYKRCLYIAFILHVVSTILTLFATGYWSLYIATFIFGLANGTVEAYINVVVASMYPKQKTKWLNILHAAWPAGIMLAGILAIGMGHIDWRWKVGLVLVPTLIYGVMALPRKFPVSERVEKGVSYQEMLQEFGVIGAVIVSSLMVAEVGRVFAFPLWLVIGLVIVLSAIFGHFARWKMGHPIFIFLVLIMIPLATTELGTDSWISALMEPAMRKLGLAGGWVLVYTTFIMMILRSFAGPFVEFFKPLGLLAFCSALAIVGLLLLSSVEAWYTILIAATIYGVGKTFFWPTMLGVVGEQTPKGGALTMNSIGGVGMLGVGVVGAVFLGNIQDRTIEAELRENQPAIHAEVVGEPMISVIGAYQPVDLAKVEQLPEDEKAIAHDIMDMAKQKALSSVAIFPAIMLVCYIALIIYFRSKGGYRIQEIGDGH